MRRHTIAVSGPSADAGSVLFQQARKLRRRRRVWYPFRTAPDHHDVTAVGSRVEVHGNLVIDLEMP
jgi:hypothetical protein